MPMARAHKTTTMKKLFSLLLITLLASAVSGIQAANADVTLSFSNPEAVAKVTNSLYSGATEYPVVDGKAVFSYNPDGWTGKVAYVFLEDGYEITGLKKDGESIASSDSYPQTWFYDYGDEAWYIYPDNIASDGDTIEITIEEAEEKDPSSWVYTFVCDPSIVQLSGSYGTKLAGITADEATETGYTVTGMTPNSSYITVSLKSGYTQSYEIVKITAITEDGAEKEVAKTYGYYYIYFNEYPESTTFNVEVEEVKPYQFTIHCDEDMLDISSYGAEISSWEDGAYTVSGYFSSVTCELKSAYSNDYKITKALCTTNDKEITISSYSPTRFYIYTSDGYPKVSDFEVSVGKYPTVTFKVNDLDALSAVTAYSTSYLDKFVDGELTIGYKTTTSLTFTAKNGKSITEVTCDKGNVTVNPSLPASYTAIDFSALTEDAVINVTVEDTPPVYYNFVCDDELIFATSSSFASDKLLSPVYDEATHTYTINKNALTSQYDYVYFKTAENSGRNVVDATIDGASSSYVKGSAGVWYVNSYYFNSDITVNVTTAAPRIATVKVVNSEYMDRVRFNGTALTFINDEANINLDFGTSLQIYALANHVVENVTYNGTTLLSNDYKPTYYISSVNIESVEENGVIIITFEPLVSEFAWTFVGSPEFTEDCLTITYNDMEASYADGVYTVSNIDPGSMSSVYISIKSGFGDKFELVKAYNEELGIDEIYSIYSNRITLYSFELKAGDYEFTVVTEPKAQPVTVSVIVDNPENFGVVFFTHDASNHLDFSNNKTATVTIPAENTANTMLIVQAADNQKIYSVETSEKNHSYSDILPNESVNISFPQGLVDNQTISIFTSDDAGVNDVLTDSDNNAPIYNLQGVRVDSEGLAPGMYIRNGNKFIVK